MPPFSRFCYRVTLLACLVLAAAVYAADSPWSVRTWQVDEGLSNSNVTGVVQTADGYLWIATRTKLARFDGTQLEEYSANLFVAPPSRGFRASALSRGGGLWLASDNGSIVRVDSTSSRIFLPPANLANLVPQNLLEDAEGQLLIIYRGGAMCRIVNGTIVPLTAQEGFRDGFSGSLASDAKGNVWFTRGAAVGLRRNGRFETLTQLPNPTAYARLTTARAGGVWICAGFPLVRYEEGGELIALGSFGPDSAHSRPTVLLEDRYGALWIGTWQNGLFRYDGHDFESIPVSDREINCLAEDRDGNIWVGTAGGGLCRIQPRAIALENTESGQPFDAIQSICQDTTGRIWAATQNGLLTRRTNRGWEKISGDASAPFVGVTCVTAGLEGDIWVGTNHGELCHWQEGKITRWQRGDGVGSTSIRALLADHNGNVWFALQYPDAVQRLTDGQLHNLPLPPGTHRVQALAEDSNHHIWIGGENGVVLRVAGNRIFDETPATLPLRKTIRSFHVTPDGAVWIGYAGGGVGRFKDGHFGRVMPDHGLADHDVSQITADGAGWLWLGGDRGIFKVRQQELADVIEGRAERVHCVQYGKGYGLPNLQAKFGDWPSSLHGADGRLWMPMRTTLAIIDPAKLREAPRPPVAVLKRVAVDEKIVASYRGALPMPEGDDLRNPALRLHIPAGHRRLDFQFTALSMAAPENIHFRYRLQGFDDAWIEAKTQRNASYTRLAAGDYQFEVAAGDGTGAWSTTSATISISVPPFFWQTTWFQFSVLGIFAASIAATVRYVSFRRLRAQVRALQQQASLDKERTRIARDIHDDLGGSLTHMTLLLELTLNDRQSPERVAGHTEQGLTTARRIIRSLDETVWAVNPRNDTLKHLINYIGECSCDFMRAAGIRFHAELPPHPPNQPVSSEVRHHLFFVVKEALNNIVRHASATEATLRITTSSESLRLIVTDNGQGFAQPPDDAVSDGLRNMQQRMVEIGGQMIIESQPGTGTTLSFLYPWPRRK